MIALHHAYQHNLHAIDVVEDTDVEIQLLFTTHRFTDVYTTAVQHNNNHNLQDDEGLRTQGKPRCCVPPESCSINTCVQG